MSRVKGHLLGETWPQASSSSSPPRCHVSRQPSLIPFAPNPGQLGGIKTDPPCGECHRNRPRGGWLLCVLARLLFACHEAALGVPAWLP